MTRCTIKKKNDHRRKKPKKGETENRKKGEQGKGQGEQEKRKTGTGGKPTKGETGKQCEQEKNYKIRCVRKILYDNVVRGGQG